MQRSSEAWQTDLTNCSKQIRWPLHMLESARADPLTEDLYHLSTYTHARTHATHARTHARTHTHTHTDTRTRTHTDTHTHTHTHTDTLTPHTHRHTHTHTHVGFPCFMGTFHRRNGLYTVQTVYLYPYRPIPKPNHHRRHSAILHFQRNIT